MRMSRNFAKVPNDPFCTPFSRSAWSTLEWNVTLSAACHWSLQSAGLICEQIRSNGTQYEVYVHQMYKLYIHCTWSRDAGTGGPYIYLCSVHSYINNSSKMLRCPFHLMHKASVQLEICPALRDDTDRNSKAKCHPLRMCCWRCFGISGW